MRYSFTPVVRSFHALWLVISLKKFFFLPISAMNERGLGFYTLDNEISVTGMNNEMWMCVLSDKGILHM